MATRYVLVASVKKMNKKEAWYDQKKEEFNYQHAAIEVVISR